MNPIKKITSWYFSKRALPIWAILIIDSLIVIFSGILCYALDHGMANTVGVVVPLFKTLCLYLPFCYVGFKVMRTYRGVMRYSSFVDLWRIGVAMFVAMVLALVANLFIGDNSIFMPLRNSDLIATFFVSAFLMCAIRVFVKILYDQLTFINESTKRTFIYGVKHGGIGLAKNIKNTEPKSYILRGFVCNDDDMAGKLLMSVNVYKDDERLIGVMKRNRIKVLLVSPLMQNEFIQKKSLIDDLISAGIIIKILNPAQSWDGKSDLNAANFREIEIEDLLPRDEIQVNMESIGKLLKGSVVLITGSAGSIGSEIVRQVAALQPANLVLIDEAETPQHDIRLMMNKRFPETQYEAIVTTICRKERMENIFKTYKPDYVFHAAAYKHVPMMEDNPSEAIENNVYGTKVVADLSVKYGVKKFVMISTDKAVNPTNVMGCSKRICEIYVQSLDKAIKDGKIHGVTQFVTTRFGNVLGSNGSVIPLFKQQIRYGGPVTVTDPRVIRFFMLISEACKLVLEAVTMGNGGEIFVFNMGQPVKIADLAKRMIMLSGATNVEIKYVGLREGEKLYEEVLDDQEITLPTSNNKIKVAKVRQYDFEEVSKTIEGLIQCSYQFDNMKTVSMMKDIVPEYKSKNSIYESLDK